MILIHKIEYVQNDNGHGSNLKRILVFLLLAFLIPLICVILIKDVMDFSNILAFFLFGVEAASPSLAAILTVLFSGAELRQFLKRCYVNNFNLKMVLVSFFLPVVVVSVPKSFYWLLYGITPTFGALSPKKIIIICWALIAEELGWRGFLQNKLEIYLNKLILPLPLGIIWALWHYHFFISGAISVPILLFTLGCITDSYLYFAFTKAVKGNIVPASVLHFSENLCFNLFLVNPEYNNGSSVPYLLYVISSLITAAIAFSIKCKEKDTTVL